MESCDAEEFGFKLRVSEDLMEETVLSYSPATGMLKFDAAAPTAEAKAYANANWKRSVKTS
ncbi:GH32 C-terminal domain-containing protein [Paenibacillus sp. p3-SID867]|nr:GH32 C-terminal domain-containing protein [Paenibacillus sp. p3-SID867]